MSLKYVAGIVLLVAVLMGCTAGGDDPVTALETNVAVVQNPVESLAPIDSAELTILETFPVQVVLDVEGQFPNDCTDIVRVDQVQGGNTFAVEVIALSPRSADAVCLPVPTTYQQTIELDVVGLLAGTYTVNVNGNVQTFTLAVDNTLQPPTPQPDVAPTEPSVESGTAQPTDVFTLTGTVFHDVCAVSEAGDDASEGCVASETGGFLANGVLENDEPPLVGVELLISLGACPGGEPFAMAITDEAGSFTFADLRPGSYCVGAPISVEPNATLLIPGLWTTPNLEGFQTVEISADTELPPFGWDYQFLPNPDAADLNAADGDNVILNDPGCINLAAFDGDITIPDDTPFEPQTPITKIWRFINTGSCGWGSGYALRFVDGALMDGVTSVPIEEIVLPGEAIEIAVDLVTPAELGDYQGDWLFSDPEGELFGIGGDNLPVWVRLKVVEANTLGSISGFFWDDQCDSFGYQFGVSALPAGCVENENGTIRADGVYDPEEEAPIEDVTIELGLGACGGAEPIQRTRTDSGGRYRFDSLTAGVYCVYVEILTQANFPILIPGDFTAPAPSRAGITVELAEDADVDSADFGWDFDEDITD